VGTKIRAPGPIRGERTRDEKSAVESMRFKHQLQPVSSPRMPLHELAAQSWLHLATSAIGLALQCSSPMTSQAEGRGFDPSSASTPAKSPLRDWLGFLRPVENRRRQLGNRGSGAQTRSPHEGQSGPTFTPFARTAPVRASARHRAHEFDVFLRRRFAVFRRSGCWEGSRDRAVSRPARTCRRRRPSRTSGCRSA
jgi:hypothetical protein